MRRTKAEIARDRDELVYVLEDAGKPLNTETVICRAYGHPEGGTGWWADYTTAYADLRALVRAGRLMQVPGDGYYQMFWSLPDPDVLSQQDVLEDVRDVIEQQRDWEDAGDVTPAG